MNDRSAKRLPPTFFAYMPRDVDTVAPVARVLAGRQWLSAQGIPTEGRELMPHPILARDLARKLRMPLSNASEVVKWLQSAHLLDESGVLLVDPRRFETRLYEHLRLSNDEDQRRPVREIFRAAYAVHEGTAEFVSDAADFMLRHSLRAPAGSRS